MFILDLMRKKLPIVKVTYTMGRNSLHALVDGTTKTPQSFFAEPCFEVTPNDVVCSFQNVPIEGQKEPGLGCVVQEVTMHCFFPKEVISMAALIQSTDSDYEMFLDVLERHEDDMQKQGKKVTTPRKQIVLVNS